MSSATSSSYAQRSCIIRPIRTVHGSGPTPRSMSSTRVKLHDCLRALYQVFQGEPCLFLIDDCAATKALTKKKDMLSELAFSGRHAGASVWVLTQKFNAVGKDLREQTKWVALFHCKDRDSFEDCLRENDVIPTREERAAVRQLLAETKHAKLVLKTDQPAATRCYAELSRLLCKLHHPAGRVGHPCLGGVHLC